MYSTPTPVTVVHIPWGIFRRGTHNPYAVNFLVDLLEDFIIEPLSIVNFRLSDPSPHRARLIPTSYMVKRRRWMFFYDINMLKESGVVFRIVDRRKGLKPSRYLVEVDGERTWCFLKDLRWLMGRYGREKIKSILLFRPDLVRQEILKTTLELIKSKQPFVILFIKIRSPEK